MVHRVLINRRRATWAEVALVLVLTSSWIAPLGAQAPAPPPAQVQAVSDTFFGTVVVDPYRWLEHTKDSAVVAWMKAQNDFTRSLLDRIPGRGALLERLHALDNAGTAVSGVQIAGARLFYFKTEPGSDNRKLYVREGQKGAERLLVDPEKLASASGPHFSIDYFAPSLDGKLLAYGVSPGGSENSVLHVLEVDSGRLLSDSITRANFGGVAWRRDNRSFFYNRLHELAPDAPPTARYQNSRVSLHTLGRTADEDQAVLGTGVGSAVEIGINDIPFIFITPASPYVFGIIGHGVQNEITLYVAPDSAVRGAATVWRKVADVDDAVTNIDARGKTLYLLTHKDALRYKVVRLDLGQPRATPAQGALVVPPGEAVVTSIGVAQDALYVQLLDGGIGRLVRVPFSSGTPERLALPWEGAISSFVTDPRHPGALVQLTGWIESPRWYEVDPRTKRVTDTGLEQASPIDFSAMESEEVKVTSADGTRVPLSIVHRRGLARDGSHRTLLDGYGAYGISYDPAFVPMVLAWLERDGVFAVCHVRGGGEYGEEWHLGGKLATKPNTIADFIACGEYLVAEHYTTASRLAGEGTSAGGITIGRSITQRPELFRAALVRVGDSDALRSETMESGPANIPEFGTVKTADGFHALQAMDAYQNVKTGTPYPAVLLTTGVNDPRVAPWQAAKLTARLQASTSSGYPILLRVDYDAGHGIGSTKAQREAELADTWSFLEWQLGDPAFQMAKVAP